MCTHALPPVLIRHNFTLPKVPSRPSLRWKSLRYLYCGCLTGFCRWQYFCVGTVSIVDAIESLQWIDIFVFSFRRLLTLAQNKNFQARLGGIRRAKTHKADTFAGRICRGVTANILAVVSAYCPLLASDSAKMTTMRSTLRWLHCNCATSLTGKRSYAVLLVNSLPSRINFMNDFSVSLPFVTRCF